MRKIIFLAISFAFVLGSVLYTTHLAEELSLEEHKKMEIWAEATRQMIMAGEDDDITFAADILEGNTTIPVFMTDTAGGLISSRNIDIPSRLEKEGMEEEKAAFLQKEVDKLIREGAEPIEVIIPNITTQYIYYDQSNTLRQLQLLPYLQFLLILIFFAVAIITITTSQKAEENRVWVGLSKETAHQLGTPISSLNAWNELLKTQYPDNPAFQEIDSDILRLTTITERFSKIGSRPKLTPCTLAPVVEEAMQYMQSRTSSRVTYELKKEAEGAVLLNPALFTWVVENLLKNAVDAMNGEGHICLHIAEDDSQVILDISDTGKGIEHRNWRRIFRPGFTTKQRGWGLGLSLARRIVCDYHHGSIFVQHSEMGHGTTFRIKIKRA